MTDDEAENGEASHTTEETVDGRSVQIDAGFYSIQVWGDPDDSFDAVMENAHEAADRAKADVKELDERLDGDDRHYS